MMRRSLQDISHNVQFLILNSHRHVSVFMCQLNHKRITYLHDEDEDDAGKKRPKPKSILEINKKKKLNKSFSRSRHRRFSSLNVLFLYSCHRQQFHLNIFLLSYSLFPHLQQQHQQNMIILNYMLWWQKAKKNATKLKTESVWWIVVVASRCKVVGKNNKSNDIQNCRNLVLALTAR